MLNIDIDKCCYCGGCVGCCPKDALTLEDTIIVCDKTKCIECGICVKFCPVDALTILEHIEPFIESFTHEELIKLEQEHKEEQSKKRKWKFKIF